jgi:drug/metabolite transporter (DMT)-like permease
MQKGIAYGLASATLFGICTPVAKILADTVSPVMLAGLLYAGSGLGLLLLLVSRRLSSKHRAPIIMPRGTEWCAGSPAPSCLAASSVPRR